MTANRLTPDQYDAICGDLFEVETCHIKATGKTGYFVRSLIPHGDVTVIGWESNIFESEDQAWSQLHQHLCETSRKPLSTRWFLKAHRTVLSK